MTTTRFSRVLPLTLLIAGALQAAEPSKQTVRVLWRDPADLESRNLLYGAGGKNDTPIAGPFEFVKEDMNGTNPKFTVKDSKGLKWKVKLGPEARPETVATRFVWAAGYFTDEDYFVERAQITAVPFERLRRVKGGISSDSLVHNARFELEHPDGEKKDSTWSWKHSEFAGSRELNGLRTLMALVNNWDLKEENNTVYLLHSDGDALYVVSDLGATFGGTSLGWNHAKSRGNLKAYERSRFITHKHANRVDFASPGRPAIIEIFNPYEYFMRVRLESIGHHIPRADAKWIGTILARLSPEQIRDAFRAGGYTPKEVEAYASVVEKRIAALNAL
ncbi:MAG TPA: hypothetical protein VGL53_01645 [Bryobacteraceae bacterium]|jgi:hypothetical protein